MNILYILLALVVLLVLITVHEFGHYCAGKIFGFKINEFSIGFGPAIFKRKRKDGEIFSIRALPLGGYCAFEGEDEDENASSNDDKKEEKTETQNLNDEESVETKQDSQENAEQSNQTIEEEKKEESVEKVEQKKPVEGSFNTMAAWKRLVVLLAGVTFNFLFAILTSAIYLMVTGFATVQISATLKTTNFRFGTHGFHKGDIVIAVEGKKVEAYRSFATMIQDYGKDEDFVVTVDRDGVLMDITTRKQEFPAFYFVSYNEYFKGKLFAEDGRAIGLDVFIDIVSSIDTSVETGDEKGKGGALKERLSTIYKSGDTTLSKEERGTWGDNIDLLLNGDEEKGIYTCITYAPEGVSIGIIQQNYAKEYSFFESIGKSIPFAFYLCKLILVSLVGLFTGAIAVSEAGGTITAISQMAEISKMGIGPFLLMIPLLSANLALFNVLPVPSLDGARSVFVLIEMIFKKPVPRHIEGWIHTIGLFALLALVVFLDINHFIACPIILLL
ncbi:MAG: site-2 protease family protein [Clostridia bacterium]|nr:site-2 protease family protein [Clostridia bacterium]